MDKTNNRLLNTAIYLRLSNEDRDKISKNEMSESIKNQRNMLLDYIAKNKNFYLIGEYSDEDLSGAGTYRPEFERLIKDCEDGKIDVVLCKSQSRFSRDMEIVEKYINNKFKEWNIRFIGLSDNADTENSGNKKARQINGLVNEWYLEDVSNNIRTAFNSKMKQGEFISPFAPYGYKISKEDNNKLVIDEEAAVVVKKIFNMYLKGLGYTAIAKYLNDKNIACPSLYKYRKGIKLNVVSNKARDEIKWSSKMIKMILTNEIYLGNLIQGKRTTVSYKNHKVIAKPKDEWIKYENTHDAIIDKETFSKVNLAIKVRTKPIKGTGSVHIFSGKVFCSVCKNMMRKKNSAKHEYLVCTLHQSNSNDCNNKTGIRYDVLQMVVLKKINQKIKDYYNWDFLESEIRKKLINKKEKDLMLLKKEKKEIVSQISNIRNYLKNIYEDKVNGIIFLHQFRYLNECYKKEEEKLRERLDVINHKLNHQSKTIINEHDLLNKYAKLENLNKYIVDEFVDKIYIGNLNKETNTRDIEIKWSFE